MAELVDAFSLTLRLETETESKHHRSIYPSAKHTKHVSLLSVLAIFLIICIPVAQISITFLSHHHPLPNMNKKKRKLLPKHAAAAVDDVDLSCVSTFSTCEFIDRGKKNCQSM